MHTINDPARVTHIVLVNKKSFSVRLGTFEQKGDFYSFEYSPGVFGESRRTSVRAEFVASVTEDV